MFRVRVSSMNQLHLDADFRGSNFFNNNFFSIARQHFRDNQLNLQPRMQIYALNYLRNSWTTEFIPNDSLLIPLNVCRKEQLYKPWECEHERHIYEKSVYLLLFITYLVELTMGYSTPPVHT